MLVCLYVFIFLNDHCREQVIKINFCEYNFGNMDKNNIEKSFDDLDEDVKREIFQCLDKKSLLSCFEVCKE